MLKFDLWSKVRILRNEILKIDSSVEIKNLIELNIEEIRKEGASEKDVIDFFDHLNVLLLTQMVTESQDHSVTNDNVKRAREILKQLKNELKSK
jgi:uncharacterized membrane protein